MRPLLALALLLPAVALVGAGTTLPALAELQKVVDESIRPCNCTEKVCDHRSQYKEGSCKVVTAPDGAHCDTSKCWSKQFCYKGQCMGGYRAECPKHPEECKRYVCSELTGKCTEVINVIDGKPCSNGTCKSGLCVPPTTCPTTCRKHPEECKNYVCNESIGKCTKVENVRDGTLCSSGTCSSGVCVPLACPKHPDPCLQYVYDPATKNCTDVPAKDGTKCSDGKCTLGGKCKKGKCVGGRPVTCPAHPEECKKYVCSESTGKCTEVENAPNGVPCGTGGTCSSGICAGQVTCPPHPDPCLQYVFNPDTNNCTAIPGNDGATCSDGRRCTVRDRCVSGVCVGTPKRCQQPGGAQCVQAVCDEATGSCTTVQAPVDTPCNDSNNCTTSDVCDDDGSCIGTPRDCGAHPNQCKSLQCNPFTGSCETVYDGDGTPCDDGLFCTIRDVCVGGECTGAPLRCPIPLSTAFQCLQGVCNEAEKQCELGPQPDGRVCDVPSTGRCSVDTCQNGTCVVDSVVDCTALSDSCNEGQCNTADGTCAKVARPNGSVCDDGLYCSATGTATCTAGVCGGGQPKPCPVPLIINNCRLSVCSELYGGCLSVEKPCDSPELNDACNVGKCDPFTGQCTKVPTNKGGQCSDGLFCTTNDKCDDEGRCVGTPRDCGTAANACKKAVCDEAADICTEINQPDGTGCDGGIGGQCSVSTCLAGECKPGPPKTCSAFSDACNVGVCIPETGACVQIPKPNGTTCDSGFFCTVNSVCSGGECGGGAPRVCPSTSLCETRVCNEASDACDIVIPKDCSALDSDCQVGRCNPNNGECFAEKANEGQACEDGLFCTVNSVCSNGTCSGSSPRNCSAGLDPCQVGVCDETANNCTSAPKDCVTLNGPCSVGQCSPQNGNCYALPKPNGTVCDNDNVTIGSCDGTCQAGICDQQCPTPPATCRANTDCGADLCCCSGECKPDLGGGCGLTCSDNACQKAGGSTCHCIKSCSGPNCSSAGGNPCRSNGVCCCARGAAGSAFEDSCINCRAQCNGQSCTGNLPPEEVQQVCTSNVTSRSSNPFTP